MLTHTDPGSRLSSRLLASQYFVLGSNHFFTTLFHRHRGPIYRLCLTYLKDPIEAEDATMEIFGYLSGHLRKYQVQHFVSWLLRFSRNHCLRRIEKSARQIQLRKLLQRDLARCDQQPELKLVEEDPLEKLQTAIRQLKEEQRSCLLRFYFHKQSYKEIARELDLSDKEVKSHIQNGKRNLRKFLVVGS